jgi:hypothetical protein
MERFLLGLALICARKRMYDLCDGYACTEEGWPPYARACRDYYAVRDRCRALYGWSI